MEFKIKPEKLASAFMLPTEVADSHIKLAGALQLRVIIYCYRHMAESLEPSVVAEALAVDCEDVKDALLFWCELGLLNCDKNIVHQKEVKTVATKNPPKKVVKPNRGEVAKRGLEDKEIAFLLTEAQVKFGRTLKQSECSSLVWMFDDLGLDASVILMAVEYALQVGRCNVNYIEKIAKDWADGGVLTIEDAERKIVELSNTRLAWNVMRSAFGLDMRAPSESESRLAVKAVSQWKMSREVLKAAYDVCIDSIGKYRASYIKSVLEAWNKDGIKTKEDLEKQNEGKSNASDNKKGGYASYDLSVVDQLINGD
ncbi:MAG: DnaD domain protein [Clostridia bacterium]|nr:DnaD domain protein [Clostridia bacterium]